MDSLHIDDLEAAINHWRGRAPAAGDAALGPELAALAEVYARQVVGAGRLDQPQYMAGLRDIAARHPQLPLPFLQWQTPPSRVARAHAPAAQPSA